MNSHTKTLLRDNFEFFVMKVFQDLHDGNKLGSQPYIEYLCHEFEDVANGKTKRLVVNLPPRHLKTFMGSICLAAWVLGRKPATKILIVTYVDQLAQHISYNIRQILQLAWFRTVFATRLADDRAKVNDFATTQGGGVYAASAGGALTGRGGDMIIFDDPLNIGDANNLEQIERVNERFDSLIMSRLDNPKTGKVVIIAHRLHAEDLSGHVLEQSGWRHVCLPMIAPRKKSFKFGKYTWVRKRGSLLRPRAFGSKELKAAQANAAPDFDTLYQQNPGGGLSVRIKKDWFQTFLPGSMQPLPIVLSIDPGHRGGDGRSYSVIQAWACSGGNYFLIDQLRVQCKFKTLRSAYWAFVRKYRPVVALIEATANGPALIDDARRRPRVQVIDVSPDGRSKADRLRNHLGIIKTRRIHLAEGRSWKDEFINEFIAFPSSAFDDQVDATTQYLDWIKTNPPLNLPAPRALAAGMSSRGGSIPVKASTSPAIEQTNVGVVGKKSLWWR
jgi:predicted phage terminase large subunit-like protein